LTFEVSSVCVLSVSPGSAATICTVDPEHDGAMFGKPRLSSGAAKQARMLCVPTESSVVVNDAELLTTDAE